MKLRLAMLAATAIAVPLSFVATPYPRELVLQHVPTIAGLALLCFIDRRFRPSTTSFGCSIAFLMLHIIGARWIYSYVPYDTWVQWVTGGTLAEWFSWERNHYDRFVHFMSGVLGLPIFSELLQRTCGVKPLAGTLLALSCVLAIGAVYEVLEWQIAITFSPRFAESYNGQQGDVWDPQKDMALAGLGGLICIPLIRRWTPSKAHRAVHPE